MKIKHRTELHVFTRAEIEEFLGKMAKLRIIGGIFEGTLGPQKITWIEGGGIEIRTEVNEKIK